MEKNLEKRHLITDRTRYIGHWFQTE